MASKEFLKVEADSAGESNSDNGWQELAGQAREVWSEEAIKKLPLEELYPQKDGESKDDYQKRLENIDALTSEEPDEGEPQNYKFVEYSPDISSEFEKFLSVDILQKEADDRKERDYNTRYSDEDKRAVDRKRKVIEESDAGKRADELSRDKISKAFELYFGQLPKMGFFDLDGQDPAKTVYPSEYDDYERGADDAVEMPIVTRDGRGEKKVSRKLIAFDLTTGSLKQERLKELVHGAGCGLTSLQYPSTDSRSRLGPTGDIPNFVIFLPFPRIKDAGQREARYEETLDRISNVEHPREEIPDRSTLEEFLDSMSRGEMPSREIQDLINFEIAAQAAVFSQRYGYDEIRLSKLNQTPGVLKRLAHVRRRKEFFDDLRVFFGGRISAEARKGDVGQLVTHNSEIGTFLSELVNFVNASQNTLTVNSYSASPDD